jgi:hypothetical protein
VIIVSQLLSVARAAVRATEYLPGRTLNGAAEGRDWDSDIPSAKLVNHTCTGDLSVYRECPVCHEEVLEDHNFATGKPITNHYAEHYTRQHLGGGNVPTQTKDKDTSITPEQKEEAREEAAAQSLSERHAEAEENERNRPASTGTTNGTAKPRAARPFPHQRGGARDAQEGQDEAGHGRGP